MNNKSLAKTALACAFLAVPVTASANLVEFSSLTSVGTFQKTTGPVAIAGAGLSVTGGVVGDNGMTQPLTIANDGGNEIGFGVCGPGDIDTGPGANLCDSAFALDTEYGTWNGELDELENMTDNEYITITETTGVLTGDFLLGSFDGSEAGTVTYGGNTVEFQRTGGASAIIHSSTLAGSSISLFGPANVWLLSLAGFDAGISSVTFTAGCTAVGCGDNNDYLVAGATVVPIPAAAWLFGSALLGIAGIARRKAAIQA